MEKEPHLRPRRVFPLLVDQTWQQIDNFNIKDPMNCLETEQENLRSALDWLEANEPESGLRVAGRLWRFWEMRGHAQEGRTRLHTLLERCEEGPPTMDHAQAHHASGALAALTGDYPNALRHYEQARAIAQSLGNLYYVALAKQQCALALEEMGDIAAAATLLEEAIALYQQLGKTKWSPTINPIWLFSPCSRETIPERRSLLAQALKFQRGVSDLRSIAITLNNLGDVARNQGDYERARACQAESLQITCDIGAKRGSAYALEAFADIAVCESQWERAAYFWGAAQTLRETNGYPLAPSERAAFDAQLTEVKTVVWPKNNLLLTGTPDAPLPYSKPSRSRSPTQGSDAFDPRIENLIVTHKPLEMGTTH